ncbi:MAG: YfhO family protein [Archangium sp.]|nr:YfhO family protein [Archangium sp.]
MHRWSSRALLIGPVLLGLALVCRGLLAGEAPVMRDYLLFEIPIKAGIAEAFSSGHIPSWWPWDGFGVPLAAAPNTTVFHPSSLLLLLPFRAGFVLQLFWNAVVGGWGCYRVARALGARQTFAAVSLTAWVLSGWGLSLMEQTAFALGASALPWAWWAALHLRRRPRVAVVVLALSVANMVLSGDLILLYAAVVSVPLLAAPRRWPAALASGALAGGLSAVQWLATLSLLRESPRREGQGLFTSQYWNFSPTHWAQLVAPTPHLESATTVYFSSVYLGPLLLALAALGLLRATPRRWAWGALMLGSVVVAAGGDAPAWGLLSRFAPGWKGIQFPAKAIGPFMAVVCVLSGLGAQRLVRLVTAGRAVAWAGLVLGALASAVVAPVAALTGVPAIFGARWAARHRPRWAGAIVALGAAADLTWAHWNLVLTMPWDTLVGSPIAETLRAGGVARTGYAYGQSAPQPTTPWVIAMAEQFQRSVYPLVNALEGLPTGQAYLPSISHRYAALVGNHQDRWLSGLAGVFGVRYLVIDADKLTPAQLDRIRGADERVPAVVYELRRVLPRAYVTTGAKVLPEAEAVAYLLSPAFAPGREVVLAEDGPYAAPVSLARQPGPPATPVTRITADADDVALEVEVGEPSLVVLNESIFDGVTATLDGAPTPVYAANHMVRAVAVPPGNHRVQFRYETPGLRVGALISLVSLVALGLWLLRTR